MNDNEQRIAIAEACGWKYWHDDQETLMLRPDEKWPAFPSWVKRGMKPGPGHNPVSDVSSLPDYPNDLNAMHEAEKTLPDGIKHRSYAMALHRVVCGFDDDKWLEPLDWRCAHDLVTATARQRCEAFLKVKGLWYDTAQKDIPNEKQG